MSPRSDRNRSESVPSTPGAASAIEKRAARPPRRITPTEQLTSVLGSLVDVSKDQLVGIRDMKASHEGLRRDIAELKNEWKLRTEAERGEVERRLQTEREREDRQHDERIDILKQIEKNARVAARDLGSSTARDAEIEIQNVGLDCSTAILMNLPPLTCFVF